MKINKVVSAGVVALMFGMGCQANAALVTGTMEFQITRFSSVLDPSTSEYVDNPYATDIWNVGDSITVSFTFDNESTVFHTYSAGYDFHWDTADDITTIGTSSDPSWYATDGVFDFDRNMDLYFSRGQTIFSERFNVRNFGYATPWLNYTRRDGTYLEYNARNENAQFKLYQSDFNPIYIQHSIYADLVSYSEAPAAVPVPPALILFASGLVGLIGTRLKKK